MDFDAILNEENLSTYEFRELGHGHSISSDFLEFKVKNAKKV